MSHPGNVFFQGLIEARHEEHSRSHQDGKAKITWWVIDTTEAAGGRFLEWNAEGTWSQIIDRSHIRSKVSSYFRTYRRKMNAMKNNQVSESATSEFILQDGKKRKRSNEDACDAILF